ncbi:MAG: nitrilase-related carbon-nitrogen hydrolase [Roseiflexaceae bacterium]|nr:nitrilase-related carbon-nitrogen hydrolase [Roseiflexaceae bacterium]
MEQTCELIVDAGRARAARIVFPEAYLPGYLLWLWNGPDGDNFACQLHDLVIEVTLTIPSDVSDRLCRVAKRSRVAVAIGLVERDNNTCYSTMLFIDAAGRICGHYRMPLVGGQHCWTPINSSIMVNDQNQDVIGMQ